MKRDSVGSPYTYNVGPQELCVAAGEGAGWVFGGIEVVDGADVFSGRPCIPARPGGGSLPAVHQEQLNTTHAGVHWRKQAVKKKKDTHTQATLKDRTGGGEKLQRHRQKLYQIK